LKVSVGDFYATYQEFWISLVALLRKRTLFLEAGNTAVDTAVDTVADKARTAVDTAGKAVGISGQEKKIVGCYR
jgi:diacylglycerol kinase